AWEMTPSSVNQGRVLTISSSAATTEEAEEPQPEPAPEPLLFSPGQVVMTAAVSHLVETGQLNPAPLLNRHLAGDWGTLDQEDWNTNQRALKFGDRLLSSYDIDAGGESRLWIITEANRSSTTLLLPSDY
ncbi:class I SAM-dependent methyltransferase, partial [Pseudomonas aeruginosa]|nr:class I SAM-dependent methyltransferase [Pseudomonas aeruginosa]